MPTHLKDKIAIEMICQKSTFCSMASKIILVPTMNNRRFNICKRISKCSFLIGMQRFVSEK